MNRIARLLMVLLPTMVSWATIHFPQNSQFISTPKYLIQPGALVFNMNYASAEIQNPELTQLIPNNSRLKQVDLVYSGYPIKPEDWIRNYDSLMLQRMEAALSIDSQALSSHVRWCITKQTECQSDSSAKLMFHGLVFYYEQISIPTLSQNDTSAWISARQTVDNIMNGIQSLEDSLVFNVLEKQNFKNMLVVTDWTGSMYPYGAQVLKWQQMHEGKNAIKGYVLFNDGNRLPDYRKRIGGTGGVYYVKSDSLAKIQRMMSIVAKLGGGGDIQENNLEAVWKGMRICKGWTDIVMIADNNAPVRDMVLLAKITVPIHIILCGVTETSGIHPNYLEIARISKGSISLMGETLNDLSTWKEGETKLLYGKKYKMKREKIVVVK